MRAGQSAGKREGEIRARTGVFCARLTLSPLPWAARCCGWRSEPTGVVRRPTNLGGGGDFIERTFAVPTPHEALRVRLLFVKVDSWDNELALLLVDGTRTP